MKITDWFSTFYWNFLLKLILANPDSYFLEAPLIGAACLILPVWLVNNEGEDRGVSLSWALVRKEIAPHSRQYAG